MQMTIHKHKNIFINNMSIFDPIYYSQCRASTDSRPITGAPMSQFSAEDEAELQSLLRQLLRSTKERISGAPSVEYAEEILLHLEETDKNFHK